MSRICFEACPESTARDAMFHDDWTVVTSDGFGTLKHQLHEAALSALRVQCDVVESSEVLAVGHKRPRALATPSPQEDSAKRNRAGKRPND